MAFKRRPVGEGYPNGWGFIDGSIPIMPNAVTKAVASVLPAHGCSRSRGSKRAAGRELADTERYTYRFHDLTCFTATELFRAGHDQGAAHRLGQAERHGLTDRRPTPPGQQPYSAKADGTSELK
jgi:hypothetical protein